jgi:exopolysaccharide biosynthesis polyprenyl glycosylphosphotransferase
MKKHELIFWSLKVPLDFLIIFSAFFLAREIRLMTDLIPGIQLPIQTIDTPSLLWFALFWAFVYITTFSFHKLYFLQIFSSKIKEFLEILRYWFYWFVFFSVFIFLWKWIIYDTDIPRLIIGFAFWLWTIWVILERIILNNIQYYLLKKWLIPKRQILLVNNKKTEKIQNILQDIKLANIYKIIWYTNSKEISNFPYKYKWSIDELQNILEKNKCDEVLYIDSDYTKKELFQLWELSRIFGLRYRYITNSFDITKTNTSLSLIHNIPVIELENTSLNNWWKIWKRFFDIITSFFGIIICFPLMFIIWILIKIEDPKWPILFKNRRVGENWKLFNLYKFRYMKWKHCVKDAYWIWENNDNALKYEQELIKTQSSRSWPLYKIKNDPRKTKIWSFIEKYSLDEIPQFFNIFLWNMSLVGPRPHQPREVEKYELEEKRLLTIKPGLTWMAQVNGREDNDFKKETRLDIFYIENWSVLLDFKIILKTFWVIIERIKK